MRIGSKLTLMETGKSGYYTTNVTSVANKIIFMLQDLNTSYIVIENIKYLRYKYPYFFSTSVDDIQKKYDEGYRIFISVSTSSILSRFLSWFGSHPDAFLISCISISSDTIFTNRPMRNIYRIAVNSSYYTPIESDIAKSYDTIYLVYQQGDNASENEKSLLSQQLIGLGKSPIEKPIRTTTDIDAIVPDITLDNNIITILSASDSDIIDYFHTAVFGPSKSGNFIEYYASLPPLDPSLANRYTFVLYEPLYERNVQKLNNQFGDTNTFFPIIDCVNCARSLQSYKSITTDTIGSYGYLYFDNVGDRNFIYYGKFLYNGTTWDRVGQVFAIGSNIFRTTVVAPISPLPSSVLDQYTFPNTIGYKICFYISKNVQTDIDLLANIAYYKYKYPIFYVEDVTLDTLYNQGYKIFIGLTTTSILTTNLPWFTSHPDAVCISLYSTGESLDSRTNTNIYRMLPPDNTSYQFYVDFITKKGYTQAYFIIEQGDTFTQDLFNGLSAIIGIPYIKYDINQSTNLSPIIATINSNPNNLGIIGVVNPIINNNLYSLLNQTNVGSFIQTLSTTLPLLGSSTTNFYYMRFNPPYERNIQQQLDTLGNVASLPLYDSVSMATQISQTGTFDPLIGSYGYSYFTTNGDKNFIVYAIYIYNGSWSVYSIYNIIENTIFAGYV